MARVLKHEGHQVESAPEPVEGMQKSRKLNPDLIVLDYHMPGNTGTHLLESLRRNNATKAPPILFMSGEASPDHILGEITDTAGSRFLPKPVPLEDFRRTVREMLAEKEQGQLSSALMRGLVLALAVLLGAAAPRPAAASVLAGIDVLERSGFEALRGKRVGLITNQTGADLSGRSDIDALFASRELTLAALFSPEHGIRGDHRDGDHVGDSTDAVTGLPIYSLYGATRRPTAAMLTGLDVLVFDIQDVGARPYTYLTTMALCMEEAAKHGLEFVVLDRPNPLGGEIMEGPVLQGPFDFTGYFPVPMRHGMTAGEIARLHADAKGLPLKLTIIKAQGWTRDELYDETGLRWTNPSPNLRGLDAALMYPGLVGFESAPVSVGRGTDAPFLWFGAPGMDAAAVARALTAAAMPGVRFTVESRTPTQDIYNGKPCLGVRVEIVDRKKVRSLDVFVRAVCALRGQKAAAFMLNGEFSALSTASGRNLYRAILNSTVPPEKILAGYAASWGAFAASRREYLLY